MLQQAKMQGEMFAFHIKAPVPFLVKHPGKNLMEQMMPQLLKSLPCLWETLMEFLVCVGMGTVYHMIEPLSSL